MPPAIEAFFLDTKWTENRGKPEIWRAEHLCLAVMTWVSDSDSFSPDHRLGFATGAARTLLRVSKG
jgi:hypothetical protein